MSVRKVARGEWQQYFNAFSKKILKDNRPEYAEIQILAESMGAQLETQWLSMMTKTIC